MKKPYSEMTPEEHWKDIHSKRNINGLIRLNLRETNEVMPYARRLSFFPGEISNRGKDILMYLEQIAANESFPEVQPQIYQCLEYHLSQFIKETSEAIKAAGELQEHLHGARQGNQTLARLRKEREEGYKPPQKISV
jgi:hypothetical protein